MTDKDLKQLSRSELLQMLIAQTEENDQLREKLKDALERLESRDIAIDNAGSIAAAALEINGVIQAAEMAASQYIENIKRMQDEAQSKADRIVAEANEYSMRMRSRLDTLLGMPLLDDEAAVEMQEIISDSSAEESAKETAEAAEAPAAQENTEPAEQEASSEPAAAADSAEEAQPMQDEAKDGAVTAEEDTDNENN